MDLKGSRFLEMLQTLLGNNFSHKEIDEKSKQRVNIRIQQLNLTLNITDGKIENVVEKNEKKIIIEKAEDITGLNIDSSHVESSKNIRSHNSTTIEVISIDRSILSNLDNTYFEVFQNFEHRLNNYLLKNNIPLNRKEVESMVNDLARETQGITNDELPNEKKKSDWKIKFINLAKSLLKILPKTAETLAIFHPITVQFSGIIGVSLDALIEGIQKAF